MSLKNLNSVGQKYLDFKVTKIIEIPEIQCVLRELVHEPTGAEVMHIANDDPENMFCLSFQTLPESSNGAAHILEHTVLCGSEKFPVKDPFFAMNGRSLNTFMNAFTGSDFTCYPAASQVPKDLYNLLEVYLDAVFKPNLNELSFLQEGHRLEFANLHDTNSPLMRKGIVFNEMKGALASGNARLFEALNKELFPDLPYGYNSGGDPKDIPRLTYHELSAFHQKYYHPSRCLFFFYGNMPLEGHLDFISKYALNDIKKGEPLPSLPKQPRFKEPKYLNLEYPVSLEEDLADKALIAFGWLTCHILEQEEVLALSVLEVILMDTDASPLKMALLKSGLCKQASVYMDTDISEVPIIISLRGCDPESAGALEEVIGKTLKSIVKEGISLDAFERAMHQFEFARSEIVGNHSPFGLSLFMRSGLLKQHGGSPENGLIIHSLFDRLRRKHLENPHYLTGLIQKYFLDNPHFVRIVMSPSQSLAAKELEEEQKNLEEIRKRLTSEQVKQIVQKSSELVTFQRMQEEEDINVLPKIQLEEVPKLSREYPLTKETLGSLQVYHHDCFTNHIVYVDLVSDLPHIAQEDLFYVRLFATLVPQMGSGGRHYTENLEYIQAHTGGISTALTFNINVSDFDKFTPSLYLRGKSLYHEAHKLFPLLLDTITSLDFTDKARLKESIHKQYSTLQNTLTQNALRYAISLSASALDLPSQISNIWFGIDYYRSIKELAENIDGKIDALISKLQYLQKNLLGLKGSDLILTCSKSMYDKLKHHEFYGLQNMPAKPYAKWQGKYSFPVVSSKGCIVSSPIASTAKVFKTVPYVHPDAPALCVAASIFENLTLHKRIREQGGAYGGGSSCNPLTGNFTFYGYRDPNITLTLSAFEEAIQTVASGNFDDADLEEAKLEMIQTLDAPVAPGSRADLAYGRLREGKTPEIRQAFRDRLLELTAEDVTKAVKEHVISEFKKGALIVFAGKELLDRENEVLASQNRDKLPLEYV